MRSKRLEIKGNQAAITQLATVIRDYALAAYPPGGSECAQAARESLNQAADALLADYDANTQSSGFSRRVRAMVRAAVEYHGQTEPEQAGLLHQMLDGELVLIE